MPFFAKLRAERSSGPTVISRRPVVRLLGEVVEGGPLAAAWEEGLIRLERTLAAVGADDRPGGDPQETVAAFRTLPRAPDAELALREAPRLLAAIAASLLAAARAPDLAWGGVRSAPPGFLAYWDDWMQGSGWAAAQGVGPMAEAALDGDEARLEELVRHTLGAVRAARPDAFAYPMVRLAEERDIAWRPIASQMYIYAYGEGVRQRWIRSTLGEDQSYASVYITLRKDLTSKVLSNAGLPVPAYRMVASRKEAVAAAEALGYPLVVKPSDASRAENVSLWLEDAEAVGEAYGLCGPDGTPAMVERQIEGEPYRLLVLGGQAIAAGRHKVPFVTGDGQSTIDQLIAIHDARAALPVEDGYRRFYPFDREYYTAQTARRLEAQNLTPDSIPEVGREVLLGYLPQRNRGGLYVDCTDRIHPGLMRMAEEVSRVIGSPTLGLDIVTTDVSQPPGSVPLAINEVNSAPIPYSHEQIDKPRIVGREALLHSFPEGDFGRIPLACFLGAADERLLQHLERLLHAAGHISGIATPDAARIDGFHLQPIGGELCHPGLAVLRDRRPDVAVFSYALRDLGQRGAAADHAEAVVLPPGRISSDQALVRLAARTLAGWPGESLVTPLGEDCAWLRKRCPQRRWIAVSARKGSAQTIAAAQAAGAGIVAVEGNSVVLTENGLRHRLFQDNAAPAEDLVWALATLLGLGFAPGEVLRLASARQPVSAAPV